MASFQPPEYQAQEIPLSLNRSPMVGAVCSGTRFIVLVMLAGCGLLMVKEVLTTEPSGRTLPSLTITPFASTWATCEAGALGQTGVQAQISHWWFRKEPPKAAWKSLSAITYCWASLPSGILLAS